MSELPAQDPLFPTESYEAPPAQQEQLARYKAHFEQIRSVNKQRLVELRALGARLDDLAVIKTRLTALERYIFGPASTVDLLEFEILFEEGISELLNNALTERRRAKLTEPPPPVQQDQFSAGLFIPGQ